MDSPLQYWNTLANQIIVISSLLAGFSITVIANLIVHEANDRLTLRLLKTASIATACFLITVFAMTNILMLTTAGYPYKVTASDLVFSKGIGVITFLFGIGALFMIIALSGWTKNRKTGIFTTVVALVTFILVLSTMIRVG